MWETLTTSVPQPFHGTVHQAQGNRLMVRYVNMLHASGWSERFKAGIELVKTNLISISLIKYLVRFIESKVNFLV